jgi:hypothetical protein
MLALLMGAYPLWTASLSLGQVSTDSSSYNKMAFDVRERPNWREHDLALDAGKRIKEGLLDKKGKRPDEPLSD